MLAALENISTKYKFSETGTGVLVALGISIPELTTNLLSCSSFKNEMIGYGFGAIVGSGVFDFTICFGIMSMFSHYHHKRAIKLKLKALLRDIYIYLITIVYLALVFWDYEVTLNSN
jgi:Ca2+/Na+ antiporter